MAASIGDVQLISNGDVFGYGFNVTNDTGFKWLTLIYKTEQEANLARAQIENATSAAVSAFIHA